MGHSGLGKRPWGGKDARTWTYRRAGSSVLDTKSSIARVCPPMTFKSLDLDTAQVWKMSALPVSFRVSFYDFNFGFSRLILSKPIHEFASLDGHGPAACHCQGAGHA